jgi:hypothetical protein
MNSEAILLISLVWRESSTANTIANALVRMAIFAIYITANIAIAINTYQFPLIEYLD